MRAAHAAEVRGFCAVGGKSFVVEFLRLVRIERQVELVVPAELEARLGECVVALLRARMAFGEVCGVRGDLVGDDALADVVAIGRPRCSLGVT